MKGKIWLGKQWVGINQIRGWSEDALHFRNQKTSAVQCRSLKKCSRVHWRGGPPYQAPRGWRGHDVGGFGSSPHALATAGQEPRLERASLRITRR